MEPGGSEPGGFNSTGGQDFGYVSDFGFDHDHYDGHGDHGHGDHGHFDHFGDDHGGDHDHGDDHGHQEHGHGHGLKGLIARLLGLDKDAGSLGGAEGGSDAHSHGAEPGQPPSQSVMYSSALAGISLSEAFKGIRVTPNFLYLCLFSGFTLWLFVVYWIRHNEPLANQVLGTYSTTTRTATDDRRLLNSVKEAMPFRTSSTFGDIYTPNAPHVPKLQPIDRELMMKANNARPLPQQPSSLAQPQTLQQKLLSTAARQPYEMSAATQQYANQYVNQAASQANMQAYPFAQAGGQRAYPAGNPYGYGSSASPYAQAYPAQIATAGSFYANTNQQMMPQAPVPGQPIYAPQPLMAVPHGMGQMQQQFGAAGSVAPYQSVQPARRKTVINQ